MIDHLSLYLLCRALIKGQNNGIVTESSLLNSAKYFWYDGYEGFNTDH
jgi:hypothetical protein